MFRLARTSVQLREKRFPISLTTYSTYHAYRNGASQPRTVSIETADGGLMLIINDRELC
jgi:hypothetical protein